MKKYFLAGGYSCGNPGDEAILKSTVYSIHSMAPDSFFYIWTDKRDFALRFDRPVSYQLVFWKPLPWTKVDHFFSKAAVKLYTDFFPVFRDLLQWGRGANAAAAAALRDAHRVIFVGGGYLNSDYCLLEMNYLCSLAKKFKKPMTLLGQTLGPFERRQHQRMADEVFRQADAIIVRDVHSLQEVGGFRSKVYCGADDAICFSPKLDEAERERIDRRLAGRGDRLLIGVNLRNWQGSRHFYPAVARELERFAAGRPVEIIFIPMETSAYCDDRPEAEHFGALLTGAHPYVKMDEPLSVEAKHYLISRLDLFIGMRLHSLVFSLGSGVPTIGLYQNEYYFRKIHGLFHAFGIEENALPLGSAAALGERLEAMFSDRRRCRDVILENKSRIARNRQSLFESVID